jgi:hypothetical protein
MTLSNLKLVHCLQKWSVFYLAGLCSSRQVENFFLGWHIHTLNFLNPNYSVITTMMIGKQDLQLNMVFKLKVRPGIFHILKISSLGEAKILISEQKNSHTDHIWDQTWCCLHDNPVLMSNH